MDKLKSLHLFSLVVESGSFVAAARVIGGDPSTISKAIQRLEQDLGVQLFQRTTRQIKITKAGESYVQHVRSMIENLSACEDSLKEETLEVRGLLKINLPISYGRLYVQPLIPEFCQLYPELDIELNYSDSYVDIIEQGYDVSVRSGTLQDKRIIARKLSSMDFITCAVPKYLDQFNIQEFTPREFHKVPWIRFRFKQSGKLMPTLIHKRGKVEALPEQQNNQRIVVDDGEAMMELCSAGTGVTQVPHFLARKFIESGQVVPVYKALTAPEAGVYILYPKREFLPMRVKAFVDFLQAKIKALGETQEGTWALKLKI